MTAIKFDFELSFSNAKIMTTACIESQEPIMLWGPPGIGKSDMIQEIGKDLDRPVTDIRLSQFESVDIKGYPYIDKKTNQMKFSMASIFPTDPDSKVILFLDEINGASPTTLLAMYQLILDRRVGEYILPEGVTMVAAGNRECDRGTIFAMPKPLENRFVHVGVKVNTAEWVTWAVENNIHKDVVGYISKNADKLFNENFTKASRAFATPRSWVKASKLISVPKNENITKELIAGCVGEGIAGEFIAFREIISKLPEPMEILTGQVKKIEKDLDFALGFVIVTSLLYTLRDLLKDRAPRADPGEQWIEYANNYFKFLLDNSEDIGPEFVAMSVKTGCSVYKLPFTKRVTNMTLMIDKYKDLLTEINTNM